MEKKVYRSKGLLFLLLICFSCLRGVSQIDHSFSPYDLSLKQAVEYSIQRDYEGLKPYFEEAYQKYPTIPRGILEAVAYVYTRFSKQSADTLDYDVSSMPRTYTVMGLTLNGKGAFRENLRKVLELSGQSLKNVLSNDHDAIMAYSSAFCALQRQFGCENAKVEDCVSVLVALSELPYDETIGCQIRWDTVEIVHKMSLFPIYSSLYAIYSFLSNSACEKYGSPAVSVDYERLFGRNLELLQRGSIKLNSISPNVKAGQGDYPGAVWCPAASCNYAVGRSLTPSNVVIHYTSGTYAGSIAWFQNCQSKVSAHYVIRSMDGQVTQMVSESNRAWHVGNENGYTIGIEHEAYGNIYSYFTPEMYVASANLVRNICQRRSIINPLHTFYRDTLDNGTTLNKGLHNLGGSSACVQIRGHQHYPSQTHTDPGPYWNWNYYYKLINAGTIHNVLTTNSGTFTDSGGELSDYANNERTLTLIHVAGADSIVLEFNTFNVEQDYDFLWIYEGNTPFSPQLGRWNTHSPGRVVARGEDMLVEFRSDCNDTKSGWVAHWHACFPITPAPESVSDAQNPVTSICWNEDDWVVGDFTLAFQDTDDVEIKHRFYQIMEKAGNVWTANPDNGFLCDNFDYALDDSMWISDGNWRAQTGALCQTDNTKDLTSVFCRCNQNTAETYLFDFYLKFNDGNTCSFYFHANGTNRSSLDFCAYQLLFDKAAHTLKVYKVNHGVATLLCAQTGIYFTTGQSYLYRIVWNKMEGEVKVFRHSMLLTSFSGLGATSWNGRYVGFATEFASVSIDNLRSYVSRTENVPITVGNSPSSMLHVQAIHQEARSKIKSIVMDGANKFSNLVEKNVKVDYTPPFLPDAVSDGLSDDVDEIWNSGVVSAHWLPGEDEESGIKSYHYYIHVYVNPYYLSKLTWMPTQLNTFFSRELQLRYPCQVVIGVKAENNAGLFSEIVYSNGAYHYEGVHPVFRLSPNPIVASKPRVKCMTMGDDSTMGSSARHEVGIYDMAGRLLKTQRLNDTNEIDMSPYAAGVYIVKVYCNNALLWTDKLIKK